MIYFKDTFAGAAGTLLTAHTSDSGATWPNDDNHVLGASPIELDGNGMVFPTGSDVEGQLPSITLPSGAFEIIYTVYAAHSQLERYRWNYSLFKYAVRLDDFKCFFYEYDQQRRIRKRLVSEWIYMFQYTWIQWNVGNWNRAIMVYQNSDIACIREFNAIHVL